PDGKTLAVGCRDLVLLWKPPAKEAHFKLGGHNGPVHVAFSPDGKAVAAADGYALPIKLWEPATGTELAALTGPGGQYQRVSYSPNGAFLAAAGHGNGLIMVWDAASRKKLWEWSVPADAAP